MRNTSFVSTEFRSQYISKKIGHLRFAHNTSQKKSVILLKIKNEADIGCFMVSHKKIKSASIHIDSDKKKNIVFNIVNRGCYDLTF